MEKLTILSKEWEEEETLISLIIFHFFNAIS